MTSQNSPTDNYDFLEILSHTRKLTHQQYFLIVLQNLSLIVYLVVLIGRAKRVPHWDVQSRFCMIYIYIYMSVCMSTVCQNA